MDSFSKRPGSARNGGGILFCGAGFSADCLNFESDETLGTGAQLLALFNGELKQDPPFRDLQNAADALWERRADHAMSQLLKDLYTVSNVTTDMVEILKYPWQTIYTTNYDNALELAAGSAGKRVEPLNNTDDPAASPKATPIIHLHGYAIDWDARNIRDSCVLGADSYRRLSNVGKWLGRFKSDVEQAQLVVFVGFNAADFHLNKAINDLTGLREKSFFINRPTARADPDVEAAQKRLGTPLYTGRNGLAGEITNVLQTEAPQEPGLASFAKYTAEPPADTVPTAEQIENLFLFGQTDPGQLARDAGNRISQYHILREVVDETLTGIENGDRIVLVTGYPCDGKSLLVNDLAHRLASPRPVYWMRQSYQTLLSEIASILHHRSDSVLVIENCFDLPVDWLASIASQFDGNDGILIMTSRTVAVDASPAGMAMLRNLRTSREVRVPRLSNDEAGILSDLTYQIAGWRDFRSLDEGARLRFILKTCEGSLPHFLLRLLKSEFVRDRYRQEFNKLSLNGHDRAMIIVALYIAHIGENAPVSFLSNAMEVDFGGLLDDLNRKQDNGAFRIVRRKGGMVETVPSIGAENILRDLFPNIEIVDAIVAILKNLAVRYRNPFEQKMFNQMMRFSILSDVVDDPSEIDRFFEHNKQEQQIRRRPLFWLQWHMAKCAVGEFVVAEKYLEQGYAEAKEEERRKRRPYDRRQLDDRRAKFLMSRALGTDRSGTDLFRDFKEACELTNKVMRQDDPQHYPYETLEQVVRTFAGTRHGLRDGHATLVRGWIKTLHEYASNRLPMVPEGYQRENAERALGIVGNWAFD